MVKTYYVYAHRNPLNNQIFYIGKGTGRRAFQTRDRSESWRAIHAELRKHGVSFAVEYLHVKVTEEEAFDLEKIELANRPNLVNIRDFKPKVDRVKDSQVSLIIKEIGKQIFEARIQKNVSRVVVAKSLGMDRRTYSAIENGTGDCQLSNLIKVLHALGLEIRV